MPTVTTLWAYLSEPLIKESQTSKFDGKATISHAQVTLPLHMCYRELLHMEKMAGLVAVT